MMMKASTWFGASTLNRTVAGTTDFTISKRPARKAPTILLDHGSIISKPLAKGEGVSVTITSGHAWITVEGEGRDHILVAQDQRDFTGPGLLVIEALERGAWVQMNWR
jgi:hypothetical protein